MKYRKTIMIILFIIIGILFLWRKGFEVIAAAPPGWQIELCANINDLKAGNFDTMDDAALQSQALAFEAPEVSIPATLEMFVRGTHEIELIWWKSENRAVRSFIMALCLEAMIGELPEWGPNFKYDISRFNEKERQERREEYDFVLEYQAGLRQLIGEILQKRVPERYQTTYKSFFNAEKSWFTKPLPQWCRDASLDKTANKDE